ncbi:MAG: sugar-binding domain-containing protein, partial [Lutimonas sp.]
MRIITILLMLLAVSISCAQTDELKPRIIEDFNREWKFNLGDDPEAHKTQFDDSVWKLLNIPHDWSIEQGYSKEETASSTGFVKGGIGWYRKEFILSKKDQDKHISILFDGVYNNSSVWINGHFLGKRPYGYSSFAYELSDFLKFDGSANIIAVKVDHSAYADSRWYTGSGIYRKVQLIKTSKLHIPLWGVQITTPVVNEDQARVMITTSLDTSEINSLENVVLKYVVFDPDGLKVSEEEVKPNNNKLMSCSLVVNQPKLWGVDIPNLYTISVSVYKNGKAVDQVNETFGIRTFNFDANNGFSLNGVPMKIKGVNLHHDAGALGAAVPKAIWEYRLQKLKSIGVNAVRLSHNPHSVELLEVCDEMGFLVMNEAFDEWDKPKGKSVVYLGDNAASDEISSAYPEEFNEWAERDLKDLVSRDFNHPSVIMWSIGNEIEWTFPHYSKIFDEVNKDSNRSSYDFVPNYDSIAIKKALERNIENGIDPLTVRARKLINWVREVDSSRPITCGSVLPSIGMVSGYGKAVDVYGFNYRLSDYDIAHKTYPDLKIIGSENWGAYNEWKSCIERDFVSGIFAWTGFAYRGEAGPWPRKGLEISFFDFAGFKTARGHFFECLWVDKPKVYMVTTPAMESEFSYTERDGWEFEMQLTPPPVWNMLRKWEWYKT